MKLDPDTVLSNPLSFKIIRRLPIRLIATEVALSSFVKAAELVNERLRNANNPHFATTLDLFDIIDLRMLSGLMGEMFALELAKLDSNLIKNPNIDGYPDLCDVSVEGSQNVFNNASSDFFIDYPSGGLEVKNTFGVKKSGISIEPRKERKDKIQKTLVWKAHHRKTNRLVALHSDYIDRVPQIISAYFSDELLEEDWTVKQQPKEGSTMTSFCQTTPRAFAKLKSGLIFSSFSGLNI